MNTPTEQQPTPTPGSITEKLWAKADANLKNEIEKKSKEISDLIPYHLKVDGRDVYGSNVITSIRDAVFNRLCHERRNKEVTEFMEKIESMKSQIEEIESRI